MNDRVNEIFPVYERKDRIRMEQEIGREIGPEFFEPGPVFLFGHDGAADRAASFSAGCGIVKGDHRDRSAVVSADCRAERRRPAGEPDAGKVRAASVFCTDACSSDAAVRERRGVVCVPGVESAGAGDFFCDDVQGFLKVAEQEFLIEFLSRLFA